MNGASKIKMKAEVMQCDTLGEVLDVLKKYYDVDNCEVGNVVKGMLCIKLDDLARQTRCEAKKQFK